MDLHNGRGASIDDADEAQKEKARNEVERKVGSGSSMPIQRRRHEEEEESRLISSLLTESEALENGHHLPETDKGGHHHQKKKSRSSRSKEVDAELLAVIAKDLNRIKRQNRITHVLLGAVIVMTAVWQVNEMSFLLWVQRKLSNPFKSLGDLVKGSLVKLKRRRPAVLESSPMPPVGIPDVARADLPTLVIGGGGDPRR